MPIRWSTIQFLLKNMPFDPDKGVQPITNLFHLIQMLVVNSALKVKTIDELIALSKAKPGTLSYLTAPPPVALYMETLKEEKGADWVRVPFKGGGEAVNAVMSGSTPIALIGEGNVIGHIRAGTMTPLVMVNNIRSPNFPDVPTWPRPATRARPRAPGTDCSRRPARRSRSSTLAKEVASIVSEPAFRDRHLTARSLVPAINTPGAVRRRACGRPRGGAAGGQGPADAAVAAVQPRCDHAWQDRRAKLGHARRMTARVAPRTPMLALLRHP